MGLSAWIGYQDIDQDTHFEWTDKTEDNFNNWAKKCTKKEEKLPMCSAEERRQQWSLRRFMSRKGALAEERRRQVSLCIPSHCLLSPGWLHRLAQKGKEVRREPRRWDQGKIEALSFRS